MHQHRIPFTDFDDPINPIAFIIEVTCETPHEAYDIAMSIEDPILGPWPHGVRTVCMRFEEILPFIRVGHAARRRSWKPDLVVRPGSISRLVLCERNFRDVNERHEIIEDWGVSEILGKDILAEDWEIAPTPPPTTT